MPTIQIVSIAGCALLLLIVLELVRQRRFLERYALLWLFSALVLLGLAVWRGALEVIANALGIIYPPNALFVVAGGFVLVLLLHFSLAVSRLSEQSKVLAQRQALLEERQRQVEARLESEAGDLSSPSSSDAEASARDSSTGTPITSATSSNQ
ncbi:MAG TPA: DUF2304 family protein [Solirubrobacteraceae bacterium]|nr:DUF2304 family protein [Solirubrobacteraceae bacterium]